MSPADRKKLLALGAVLLLASFATVVAVLVACRSSFDRGGGETSAARTMNFGSLSELVADMHAKPDVRAVGIDRVYQEGRILGHLPPDRRYECAVLDVRLAATEGSGEVTLVVVVDCTSPDRAKLLAGRLKQIEGAPAHTSGRFVVYAGGGALLAWLKRHYDLSPVD